MTACAAALLLCLVAATGYSEAPWHARRHEDSHALAQTIFKQTSLLTSHQLDKSEFASMLTRTDVLFTDPEGIEVTVRDVAFTILLAAKEIGLPEGVAPSKCIYYCFTTMDNVVHRAHIPSITDDGFRKTIASLQPAPPPPAEPQGNPAFAPEEASSP